MPTSGLRMLPMLAKQFVTFTPLCLQGEHPGEASEVCGCPNSACQSCFLLSQSSLVAQMVKNLPVKQETWIPSLGREDSLEKGMATHSSILAWRIPWTEEPGGLQSIGLQRVRQD